MIREPELLDYLAALPRNEFSGSVFRATRLGLDPLAPSTAGGRWMLQDGTAVLYTSEQKEGALAELCFHLSMITPLPSKPVMIHEVRVQLKNAIRLTKANLEELGVEGVNFLEINYQRTQLVGDAISFLGADGLLVPSARWNCWNVVIFCDNHSMNLPLELLRSEEIEWQQWASANGFIPPTGEQPQ